MAFAILSELSRGGSAIFQDVVSAATLPPAAGCTSSQTAWPICRQYPGKACLCNARRERALDNAAERGHQEWVPKLGTLLYEMKDVAGATAVAPVSGRTCMPATRP